jgi:hypothetical protein
MPLGFALYLIVVFVMAGISAATGRRVAAHRAHVAPSRWKLRDERSDGW